MPELPANHTSTGFTASLKRTVGVTVTGTLPAASAGENVTVDDRPIRSLPLPVVNVVVDDGSVFPATSCTSTIEIACVVLDASSPVNTIVNVRWPFDSEREATGNGLPPTNTSTWSRFVTRTGSSKRV